MTEHPSIHRRRLRMLYSMKDIQLALSAADFLLSCETDDPISKIELRRFKCYETTAIVSYARPFSESKGDFPKLSMKMIGVKLDDQQQSLHDELMQLRNGVVAHSDAELMRMIVKLRQLDLGDGQTMPHINTAFDEGLDFVGERVEDFLGLLHKVYSGIFKTLTEDARVNPDKFSVHHDWLYPEAYRNTEQDHLA